ncbi:MAG: helix-turn-helix domain-containing protein [Pyrinomonadaceae bacterium]
MTIEDQFAAVVRQVIRSELESFMRPDDDDLLDADSVATMLGYTDRHAVYRLVRESQLQQTRLGEKTIRFRRGEVRRFIREKTSAEDKTTETLRNSAAA